MRVIRRIACLLGLALLVACSGGADRAPENTLQRGLQVGPETLDPQRSRSAEAAEILRDLGEGLVGYSPSGELVPAAAERWDPETWPADCSDESNIMGLAVGTGRRVVRCGLVA